MSSPAQASTNPATAARAGPISVCTTRATSADLGRSGQSEPRPGRRPRAFLRTERRARHLPLDRWRHAAGPHPLAPGGYTGVIDIAADPSNPRVLFASTWQARQFPWLSYFTPIAGPAAASSARTTAARTGAAVRRRLARRARSAASASPSRAPTASARVYAVSTAARTAACIAPTMAARIGSGSMPTAPSPAITSPRHRRPARSRHRSGSMGRSIRRCDARRRRLRHLQRLPGRRRLPLIWDQPEAPRAHDRRGSDQGTVDQRQRRPHLEQLVQPADRPALPPGRRQPLPLLDLLRAAGQRHRRHRQPHRLRRRSPCATGIRSAATSATTTSPIPSDPNIVYGSGLGGHVSRWDARTGQVTDISPWPVSAIMASARRPLNTTSPG